MPVSRKNRSMKKSSRSSKRSKNSRTSKKTRKHMRKMRGGAGLNKGVNQAVDFIIYCGDEVLVSKNDGVTGDDSKFTLIGTFATASLGKNANGKRIPTSDEPAILQGMINFNKADTTPAQNSDDPPNLNDTKNINLKGLSKENALLLLKKDLKGKITEDSSKMLDNIFPVELGEQKFWSVLGDSRLSKDNCPRDICKIRTQLFKINIPNKELFKIINSDVKFLNFKTNTSDFFYGHKKILDNVFNTL